MAMANKSLTIIAAISVIGLLFLVYLAATFESPQGTSTVVVEPPVPRAPEPIQRAPAPTVAETTEVQAPVTTEPEPQIPIEPMPELPSLNESDAFVQEQLATIETGVSLLRFLATEDLIRKFVVFTDNAAQGNLPQLEYPVQRITESMAIEALDDNLFVMEPSSYSRFDAVIDTFVAVDVDRGMFLYRMMLPLFQDAYAEIGYRDRSFTPVVLAAIDSIMNAELPEGPFQLVKPSVMYLYAEQDIEDMTPIQKQLIRLGPDNTRKLQAKLAEYQTRLQGL